jgi:hypothetical protein
MFTMRLWRVIQIAVLGAGVMFFQHSQKVTQATACNACSGSSCTSGKLKGAAGCLIVDTTCNEVGTCDVAGVPPGPAPQDPPAN